MLDFRVETFIELCRTKVAQTAENLHMTAVFSKSAYKIFRRVLWL